MNKVHTLCCIMSLLLLSYTRYTGTQASLRARSGLRICHTDLFAG